MSVKFTQYKLPNGRREEIFWDNFPSDIEAKAQELFKAGAHFDIEVLMSEVVSATCEKDDLDDPILAIVLSRNGPGLEEKLNELVDNAYVKLKGESDASNQTV